MWKVSEFLICCSPSRDGHFEWSLTKIARLEAELELKLCFPWMLPYLEKDMWDFAEILTCCSPSQDGHFEWSMTKIGWLEAEEMTFFDWKMLLKRCFQSLTPIRWWRNANLVRLVLGYVHFVFFGFDRDGSQMKAWAQVSLKMLKRVAGL